MKFSLPKPTTPAPAKVTRLDLTPPSRRRSAHRHPPTDYTPDQLQAAERARTAGLSKEQAADTLGLTPHQIHYLWYVRKSQRQRTAAEQEARREDRTPLPDLVPDPVTARHQMTQPGHRYKGVRTRFRTDLIEQVLACRQQGHTADEVAEYFNLPKGSIRYMWYYLPRLIAKNKKT